MKFLVMVLAIANVAPAFAAPASQPSPAEASRDLDVIKQAKVDVADPNSDYSYAKLGLKIMGVSAAVGITSGSIALASNTLSAGAGMAGPGPILTVGGAAGGILSGYVFAGGAVAATIGGLMDIWKHSSAHAASLSEGIVSDPALMQRFLNLPKEEQMKIMDPKLLAAVHKIADKVREQNANVSDSEAAAKMVSGLKDVSSMSDSDDKRLLSSVQTSDQGQRTKRSVSGNVSGASQGGNSSMSIE